MLSRTAGGIERSGTRDPSTAATIPAGWLLLVSPAVYSVIAPAVVTRPIAPPPACSVNHKTPSAPAAIAWGAALCVGVANSVIVPVGVMRPIAWAPAVSVNQRLPSGPAAMPVGLLLLVSPVRYSVMAPLVVTRPIAPPPPHSVNHSAPSGPVTRSIGCEL